MGQIVPGGSPTVASFALGKATRPEDVVIGSDGNLWVTDSGTNQIERVGPSGVGLTFYAVPTSLSLPGGSPPAPTTTSGSPSQRLGKIGRITTGGSITEFSLGSSSAAPKGIVTGPDGNLWFTESGTNLPGRMNHASPLASLTTYACPRPARRPWASPTAPTTRSG